MRKTLLLLLVLTFPLSSAGGAEIENVRLWSAPDHTRLVFDLDGPVEHRLFSLRKPERVVVDLHNASVSAQARSAKLQNRHLQRLRLGKRAQRDLRIVLDLTQAVRPKSFVLKPERQYGYRLVIDLYDQATRGAGPLAAKGAPEVAQPRDIVIAVDAGHGGDDPGAIGRKRTREKHVTLAIAKRLKHLIDAEPGMRAELTRKGDYFVDLRKRMAIARKHRADLFLSIHADAFHDRRVHGSSVYVLSRKGASSEAARWLAAQENAADLVGGVSLDDKSELLASVLLDLSQSATQQASLTAATKVFEQLRQVGEVHGNKVQRAGFLVLKSPDIPSVLVEMGYISNPGEEANLRNSKHQKRLARALLAGVKQHFEHAPPPGTLLALRNASERKHVIKSGDTLSQIAERYQVSLSMLREENRLRGDVIRIGQVLQIPEG